MNETINQIETFCIVYCCDCGMAFGMTSDYKSRRVEDGKYFYCPSGHQQHYTETKIQALEKQLALMRSHKEQADAREAAAQNRLNAAKALNSRIRNRIAKGICPSCNRYFKNVYGHMKSKHPTPEKKTNEKS